MSESALASLARAKNHFELFTLPVRFSLDRPFFESRYLELARLAHPDFAGDDPAAQSQAVALLARINEAYAILRDDLGRARYLLELAGVPCDNAKLPGELMERVFELRERLSLAQGGEDEQGIDEVRAEAQRWAQQIIAELGKRLDAGERSAELGELASAARYVLRITTV